MEDGNGTPNPAEAGEQTDTSDGTETFSREYVERLRNEAAGHRVAKQNAVKAAKDALNSEWQGKYTDLEVQNAASGLELSRLKAAIDLNVPVDKVIQFASTLQGSTDDEITASAKTNYELFGGFKAPITPAVDPTQGSGNGNIPLNGDPILAALKAAVGVK